MSIASVHEHQMTKLRDAAKQMGVSKLADGSWFRQIVAAHIKKHAATITPAHWETLYPGVPVEERARRQIAGVARKAAASGALASVGTSTGELLSLFTDGLAAPIGVPATIVSMALEAGYTALLQIDLACDLASIYGVAFDPDDVGEVATLFGVALGVDVQKKPAPDDVGEDGDEPKGLTAKLIELEDGDIATRIGRKMLEDSAMKNIVPVLGVAISARWNYVATLRLAATVRRYVRYRSALYAALAKLKIAHVADPSLIVEGAWLLATVDGAAAHEETLAVAAILDSLPEDKRQAIELDRALGSSECDWFDELVRTPKETRDALLDVLYLVAATDKHVEESERRFLERVGKALSVQIEFDRIGQICRHLARGDALPDGFFHCAA
jgi:hypothetical protein